MFNNHQDNKMAELGAMDMVHDHIKFSPELCSFHSDLFTHGLYGFSTPQLVEPYSILSPCIEVRKESTID